MKFRPTLWIVAGLLLASCSGDTGEAASDTEAQEAAAAPSADQAAIETLAASYVESYNAHDVAALADFYTDDAVTLLANSSVNEGKEAITAGLERAMAGSPTLSVDVTEVMSVNDGAMARGSYGLQTMPEGGEAVSFSGNWLAAYTNQDGEWKLGFLITNYDAPPPEGAPVAEGPGEPPEEAGQMADLIQAYETHFNLGHASMVADLYNDEAVAAFADLPLAEGHDAITSSLAERMAEGSPQLAVHDIGTLDLGNGWKLDGGWYELTATTDEGSATQVGNYAILCQQADDGSWKIHWAVTNAKH